ncbi:MAG: SusC/RagA family TonB-linked outer membrane protein, partial [Balneolaceae bacterium]
MNAKWFVGLTFFCAMFLPRLVCAQTGTVEGKVTTTEGESLPGVNIYMPDLKRGIATNTEGVFKLEKIPIGEYTLEATFLGFKKFRKQINIEAGKVANLAIHLQSTVTGMDELVVTGVAQKTPKKKLSFTVDEIGQESLEEVPALNPASALEGKIPGLEISNSSGAPGSNADIQLRGATTIYGSSNPLIIIDGVLTEGSLSDINAQDIKSIEVVKGAAASSLYGSRAANGVINIITKRGSGLKEGQTQINFRSEVGSDLIGFVPEKTHSTNYLVQNGAVQYNLPAPDGIYDNKYPDLSTNPADQLFRPGVHTTNYLSFQSNSLGSNTSLYSSIEHTRDAGVVNTTDGLGRLNLRVNIDHYFNGKFKFSTSNLYSQSSIDHRADGIWDMFYYADPGANFKAPNENGAPYNVDPNKLGKSENPLYYINNTVSNEKRYRFLGNYQLSYDPLQSLEFKIKYGIDRIQSSSIGLTPKGKMQVNKPPSNGSIYKGENRTFAQTLQGDVFFHKAFGHFNTRFNLQYLYESNQYDSESGSGQNLAVKGMDISNLEQASENINIGSYKSLIVANNITASTEIDYKSKYILDALVRRDGVSLFGANQRWQTFYRISGAYRVTEDFKIPDVQELKIRTSYGIAGLRPPFEARYEVVGISNGNVANPVTLGNEDLKPSFSRELEVGVDANFLKRFNVTANYSRAINTDQILNVPVSASSGFATQWQNAGTLESYTLEFNLGANIIRQRDLDWNINLTWDRTRQKVVSLNRSGYAIVSGGIFQIAEGSTFGTLYGHKWATSLDQVANQVPEGQSINDYFVVNNEGYVVKRSTIGTTDEVPIKITDDLGNPINMKIGDVNPDFNMNFGSTLH